MFLFKNTYVHILPWPCVPLNFSEFHLPTRVSQMSPGFPGCLILKPHLPSQQSVHSIMSPSSLLLLVSSLPQYFLLPLPEADPGLSTTVHRILPDGTIKSHGGFLAGWPFKVSGQEREHVDPDFCRKLRCISDIRIRYNLVIRIFNPILVLSKIHMLRWIFANRNF